MAHDGTAEHDKVIADPDDDRGRRAREIDALLAGPPASLPSIVVFGDDAVFGIRPIRREA